MPGIVANRRGRRTRVEDEPRATKVDDGWGGLAGDPLEEVGDGRPHELALVGMVFVYGQPRLRRVTAGPGTWHAGVEPGRQERFRARNEYVRAPSQSNSGTRTRLPRTDHPPPNARALSANARWPR
jgi:hypothetical protein